MSAQTPSSPEQGEATAADNGEPVILGRTYTIASDALGMDRRLTVRTPAGYHEKSARSYPVVYLIDGGPEQDFPHIAGLAQSRDVNWTFAPFILVGVETVSRRSEITPPAADVEEYQRWLNAEPGGSAAFRQFLREEVRPWVDERYRTDGRAAVMGESLAGLFVVETLFEEPTLFDDYIAVSPSLWWEEKKCGREARARVAALPPGDRRLYLTMADEGSFMQEALDLLVAALAEVAPEGLTWTYVDRGDVETHASIFHVAALDAFRLLYPEATRIYRQIPLMNGSPATPRTPEQEALLAEECSPQTARRTTPADTRVDQERYVYHCMLYDYGARATAGNMDR